MQVKSMKLLMKKASISLLLFFLVMTSFAYSAPSVSADDTLIVPTELGIATVVVSEDYTAVTVTTSVYAQSTDLIDLKSAITLKRTGETDYSALGEEDSVTLTSSESSAVLDFTFDQELTGEDNSIQIEAGALVDESDAPYHTVNIGPLTGRDVTPPAFVGSRSGQGNGGEVIDLYFDENLVYNNGDMDTEAFIRSKLSISTDGVQYKPLADGTLYHSGKIISIYYEYDMPILVGTLTSIKIEAGTFGDAEGNLNELMILSDVTPPVIQDVAVSSDYHDVTITFNEDVYDATIYEDESYIKEYIALLNGGVHAEDDYWLGEDDSVSFVDNQMVIHFDQALAGASNIIVIASDAVMDRFGNTTRDEVQTPIFAGDPAGEVLDTKPPQLIGAYRINDNQDIAFVFNEPVLSNKETLDDLKDSITYNGFVTNYSTSPLPDDVTLTFSGNIFTIHFATPLSNNWVQLYISSESFKDLAGNVLSYRISQYADPAYPIYFDGGDFSHNGRWMTLYFEDDIVDNTIVDGASHLKEHISISTNQGGTFNALNGLDEVMIYGDRLVIYFQEAIKVPSVQVKIEADALIDEYGFIENEEINEVIAYNTPDVAGYFFSNTVSEFTFEDDEAWRSSVNDVLIYSYIEEVEFETIRVLTSDEYTLTAGKLTVKSGVFEEGGQYGLQIRADGYSTKEVMGMASVSSNTYYMTAPEITKTNGITATVNVLNTAPWISLMMKLEGYPTSNQSIVFQLMNGSTPVSIVSANLNMDSGTYSAKFNVADAATNPNYTVRVFIVTEFDVDSASVGINLATVVTKREFDLKQVEVESMDMGFPF